MIGPAQPAPVPGLTTVLASSGPADKPAPGLCIASDGAVATAYAILADAPVAELAGAQYLIDADGWLRTLQRAGSEGWNDPQALQADLRALRDHPLTASAPPMDPAMKM